MAKDKLGHGSEAHRSFHSPQVEHGKQHIRKQNEVNYQKALSRFSHETVKKLENFVERKQAIQAARTGTSGAPPIQHGRPK